MKSSSKLTHDYLNKYSNHHCILIKKYRTVFHYIWLLEENDNIFKIHVGKALYLQIDIGTKLTIGRIGRKLINIRTGFCKIEK